MRDTFMNANDRAEDVNTRKSVNQTKSNPEKTNFIDMEELLKQYFEI
jgi:hypothetical protein